DQQPQQQLEDGGFARARLSDDDDSLTGPGGKGNVLQNRLAESQVDVLYADNPRQGPRLGSCPKVFLGNLLQLGADGGPHSARVPGAPRHRRLILLTWMTAFRSLLAAVVAVFFVAHGWNTARRIWVRKS